MVRKLSENVKRISLVGLFTLSYFVSFAQLVATFSSPNANQCPGNLFTLNATNTTYSSYSWLVTGPSSYSSTPTGSSVALYLSTPGYYTVKLTVSNGVTSNSSTQTNYLRVYNVPTVSYTVSPTTGCSPLSVVFNGSCTPGDGTLSSFSINAGDGNLYTTEDFTNIYTNNGSTNTSFASSATITNSFGCATTSSLATVSVKPSPSLTSPLNPNSVCSGSTFNYTPVSSMTPSTFTWTRAAVSGISQAASSGSGNISEVLTNTTTSNISVTYEVTTTASNGCSRTQNVVVVVRALPTVTLNNTSLSICSGNTGTLTATGLPSGGTYAWSNSATTSSINVSTAGTYTVTYSDGTCASLSTSSTVSTTSQPTVSVAVTETSGLTNNDGVICTGASAIICATGSPSGGTYLWSTGATTSCITVSPTGTRTYTVTYTRSCPSAAGSSTISVLPLPSLAYTAQTSVACSPPLVTTFTSQSTIAGSGIQWQFPGGSPSNPPNTTQSGTGSTTVPITYNAVGTYDVIMTGTSSVGCVKTTTFPGAILVGGGNPPTSIFNPTTNLTQCYKTGSSLNSVCFQYAGTGADTIRVNWGDGVIQGFLPTQTMCHTYTSADTFIVELTPYTVNGTNLGCAGSVSSFNAIIKGPVAKFSISSLDCNNQLTRTFTNTSTGASSSAVYSWSFPSATPSTSNSSTSVTSTFSAFSASPYTVTLTVSDATTGCPSNTFSSSIYCYPNNTAAFKAYNNMLSTKVETTDVCLNGTLYFYNETPAPQLTTVQNQTNWNPAGNNNAWTAISSLRGNPFAYTFLEDGSTSVFTDAVTPGNSSGYSYSPGAVDFAMRNNKPNGSVTCIETVTKTNYIKIHGVTGTFTLPDDTVCVGTSFTVTDNLAAPLSSISSRSWDWGDGTTSTSTGNSTTKTYTSPGIYTITLVVKDNAPVSGFCSKTITKTVVAMQPTANFSVNRNYICPGQTVTVSNSSSGLGTLLYNWTVTGGTPSSSTSASPSAFTFSSAGSHSISLKVTDYKGCTNIQTNSITAQSPVASAIPSTTSVSCFNPPTVVSFTNTSSNNVDNTSAQWDFGNGQTSNSWNPSTTYSSAGTYPVKLTVSSLTGCTSPQTTVTTITIGGPLGSLNVTSSPLSGCSPFATTICVTTTGCTDAQILFGDGQFQSLTPAQLNHSNVCITHNYTNGGSSNQTFTPSLYISNGTCNGIISNGSNVITVQPVPSATISYSGSPFCSTTSGTKSVTLNGYGAYTGGAFTSTAGLSINSVNGDISPSLSTPGTYTVTYNVTATSICPTVNATASVTIQQTPSIANKTYTVCSGSAFTFASSGSDVVPAGTTYSWSAPTISPSGTITGGSAQSNQSGVSQTLTNTTTSPSTATYTVTATANGCSSTFTITTTVNPKPSVNAQTATVCTGNAFTISPSSVPTGTTYTWSAPVSSPLGAVTGGSAQASGQASISQTLANTTLNSATATYTVTPTSGTCIGTSFTATVTVTPGANIANKTYTVCSGSAFTFAATGSDVVPNGVTYSWAAPAITGTLTGSSAQNNQTTISQTLTNSLNTVATAVYTVSATSGTCTSTFTITVTVNPKPSIANATSTICSGNAFSITPTNGGGTGSSDVVPSATTYAWATPTLSPVSSITGSSAQAAQTSIGQTLTNTTTSSATATYTVTPTSGTCTGSTFSVVVTVNPLPSVSAQTSTICSASTFTIAPSGVPSGTTYAWSAPTLSPALSLTGSSAQSAQTNISQSLTNTTTATATATYTVTPTSGSCVGTTFTATVTVNPKPNVSAQTASICSGGSFSVTPTGVPTGTTYTWTTPSISPTGSVTGGSAQATAQSSVSQTLSNVTTACGVATYTVTPRSGACTGSTFTIGVTVCPNPSFTTSKSDPTTCNATNGTITLSSLVASTSYQYSYTKLGVTTGPITVTSNATGQIVISSLGAGTYDIVVTNPTTLCQSTTASVTLTNPGSPNITDIVDQTLCGTTYTLPTITGTNLPGNQAYYTGVNGTGSTLAVGTVISTSQTIYMYTSTAGGCSDQESFVVTINPVASVTAQTSTICSGSAFTVSPTGVPTGTTYTWSAPVISPSGSISGGSAQNSAQTSISQTLTTTITSAATATYTVTPTSGTCVGSSFTITVTVNPIPVISAQTATACSGSAFSLTPAGAPTGTTYTWSAPTYAPSGAGGSAQATGTTPISQTLTTTVLTGSTATYSTVTPTSGTCVGSPFSLVVTINPKPSVTNKTATICNGASFTVTPSGVPTGTTYAWGVPTSSPSGAITGTSNSGQSSVSESLVNITTSVATATYTVTPSSGTCSGNTFNVPVTVNPSANLTAQKVSACTGTSFNFTPSPVPTGTLYSWALPSVSPSGAITGTTAEGVGTTSISQTLSLLAGAVTSATATYTVTPVSGTCSGTPFTLTATITPTAVISAQTATICSGATFTINPSGVPSGTTYAWSAPSLTPSGSITGSSAQSGQTNISQALTSTITSLATATYTVTPTSGSCASTTFTATVTVNPKPSVSAQTASICSGNAFTVTPTGVPSGTTYTWSNPSISPSGSVTGGSSQGTAQSSISQTLNNSTALCGTATYTVTPRSGTCAGSTFSVAVTVCPNPTFSLSKVDPTLCNATNGSVTLSGLSASTSYSVSGFTGGPSTLNSDATGKIIVSSLGAGTYTVSVTNSTTNCQSTTQSISLLNPGAPDVNDIADQLLCGSTFTLPTITGTNLSGNQKYYTLANGGGSVIPVGTVINTSQTIYIYDATPGGCSDQESFVISINPVASIGTQNQTICSGNSFTVSPTGVPGGTTYTWSAPSISPAGSITGFTAESSPQTEITQTLSTTITTAAVANYTVTATSGSCTSTFTVIATVNPVPVVASQTATTCAGTAFTSTASGVPTGTTYTWSAPVYSNVAEMSGGSAQSNAQSSVSQIINNTSAVVETATYIVTPTSGSCSGSSYSLVVTINPTPVVSAQTATICSGTAFSVTPTGVPAGTTYSWAAPTMSSGTSGGTAQSAQSSISQTLTKGSTTAGTATYTVTPTSGACSGNTFTVTVTVNPKPVITNKTATACSGTAFTVSPTGVPAGTLYTWGNPTFNPLGGLSGETVEPLGASSVSQTLSLPIGTTTSATATYIVTPTSGICAGNTFNVVATINPLPQVTDQTATICSGAAFSVSPTGIPTGTTYTWSAPTVVSGTVSGTSAQATGVSTIGQTINNTGTSVAVVDYTVIPSATNCPGTAFHVVVTINPKPSIAANQTATICSGETFTVTPTGVPSGTTYTWGTPTDGPLNSINGESAQAISQVNISQTLTNTTSSVATETYVVTPTTGSCTGSTFNVIITVNPKPVFGLTKTNPTQCNGTNGTITITGLTASSSYNYSYEYNSVVSGPITANSNASGQIALANFASGTYNFWISKVSTGCQSDTVSVSLTNPNAPDITDIPDQVLCGTSYTLPAITGTNLPGTQAYYLAAGGVGPTVAVGTVVTGTAGSSVSYTYYLYAATPGGCSDEESFTVTIHPLPVVSSQSSICLGNNVTISPTSGGSWVSNSPSVATITSNGNVSTLTAGSATFTFTDAFTGCSQTTSAMTVKPLPTANAGLNDTICSNGVANLTGIIGGSATSIAWSSNGSGVIAPTNSANATFTPSPTDILNGSVVITLTGTDASGVCTFATSTKTIKIDAAPTVNAGSNQVICSSQTLSLSGNIGGTATSGTWTTSGTGTFSPNATILNPTYIPSTADKNLGVVTITLTTNDPYGPCNAASSSFILTINPQATINAGNDIVVCKGSPVSLNAIMGGSATTPLWTTTTGGSFANANSVSTTYQPTLTEYAGGTITLTINTDDPIGPCPAVTDDINISFANPATVNAGIDQTICSGQTATLTGVYGGSASFATWQSTGVFAPNPTSLTVNYTPTNAQITAQLATIVLMTDDPAGPCPAATDTVLVHINPTPTVATAGNLTIGSGNTTNVTISSNVPSATFTWSATDNVNVTGESTTTNTSTTIADYLENFTIHPEVVNYTVTPTVNATGCTGSPTVVNITVVPIPTMADPNDQMVCKDVSTLATNFTSPYPGVDFHWSASSDWSNIGMPFQNNQGNIPSFNSLNSTTNNLVVSINVTPYLNGIPGIPQSFTYTVLPRPTVNDPSDVIVCAGSPISTINFSGSHDSTDYNWTNTNTAIGLGASGAVNITGFTPTVPLVAPYAPIVSTITVSPSLNGCLGTPQTFTITAKPVPVMNPVPDRTICQPNISSAINFSGIPAGTIYSWDQSNPTIGLTPVSSTGNIPAFATVNQDSTIHYDSIVVTPTFAGCAGAKDTFVIIISPAVMVSHVPDFTYCHGELFPGVVPTLNVPGASLTWTCSNISISSDPISGIPQISSPGTGSIPPFNAYNTYNQDLLNQFIPDQVAIFKLTPSLPGCQGVVDTFYVTVKPRPAVYLNHTNQSICHGSNWLPVNFTSSITGTTFVWETDNTSVGLGLPPSGNGNLPSYQGNAGIFPQTGTFHVTPTYNSCTGTDSTFTIQVSPVPTVAPVADQTWCSGQNTNAVCFTGNQGTNATYNWTNSNISIWPGGTGPSSGVNCVPSFVSTNISPTNQIDTFVVTPKLNGCIGVADTFTIFVKPIPHVLSVSDQSLCAGDFTQQVCFMSTTMQNQTFFDWQNDNTAIGLGASGTGPCIPSFLGGSSGNYTIATITVTPTLQGCVGPDSTFTIKTVNPIPIVYPQPDQTLCAGATTNPVIFTGNNPTPIFHWYNSNPSIGLSALGTSSIASFTAHNGYDPATGIETGTTDQIATILCVPENSGCFGDTITFNFTVKAIPDVIVSTTSQTVCSGDNTIPINLSSNVVGTNFPWFQTNPSIFNPSGSNSSAGNIPSLVTLNGGSDILIDTIVITPTRNGCVGIKDTAFITVNPVSTVTIPNISHVYCSGDSIIPVHFSSNNSATVFNWTCNPNTAIGLPASGTGDFDSLVITNTSLTNQVVTVTVTPSIGSCPGIPASFTMLVKPIPYVVKPANQMLCSGNSTSPITMFGNLADSTSFTWNVTSGNYTGSGFPNSGVGDIPAYPMSNTFINVQTITVCIHPSLNGCNGADSCFTITVNPVSTVTNVQDITTCAGVPVTVPTFNSPNPNTNFVWSNNNTTIGLASGGAGNIPTFNPIGFPPNINCGRVIVTPYVNNCPGFSDTFNICVKPIPLANPVPNQVLCHNQNTNAVLFTGNVPSTNYDWTQTNASIGLVGSGSNSIPSFTAINTTYIQPNTPTDWVDSIYITPIVNGCAGPIISFTYTVHTLPRVDAGSDTIICIGQCATLYGSGASGYQWNNGAQNGVPVCPTQTTIYTVIGTDLNLCQNTDSVTVNYINLPPPIVNAGLDSALCFGESITLCATGNADVFQWNNGVIDCQEFTPLQTNNYELTGTALTGCVTKDTVQVIVNPLPIISANASDTFMCRGETLILWGSGADTYIWDNNVVDSVGFIPDSTGTYTVFGTDIHGCKDTADIHVVVNDVPTSLFSTNMNFGGCLPFSPTFTDLSEPASVQVTWMFGDGNVSNQLGTVSNFYNNYGCYDVTLVTTTAEGCTDTLTQQDVVCVNQIVANFDPSAIQMPISNPNFDFNNTSLNATSFQWNFGDNSGSDFVHTKHDYQEIGCYPVTLTAFAQDGCSDSITIVVCVKDEVLFYVPNSFTPDGNGVNDSFIPVLTAGYDRTGGYEFKIYDRWGELIFVTDQILQGWDGTYNGEKVQFGAYTWIIRFKDSQTNEVYESTGHVNLIR